MRLGFLWPLHRTYRRPNPLQIAGTIAREHERARGACEKIRPDRWAGTRGHPCGPAVHRRDPVVA
jgi:hypothetical protein